MPGTATAAAPAAPTADALVRLGGGRDADAWRDLVERHGPAMYRAAYAVLRDQHLAADACQEAFLHIRDGAGRFRPRGDDPEAAARGWLLRVATSSALMLARGLRRRQRREHALAEDVMAQPAATRDDADDLRLAALVAEAVAELPDSLRQPLTLHVYGGLDHAAIAAALGLSPGNARVRVHRALERLRARLTRTGAVAALAGLGVAAHAAPPPAALAGWTALISSPLNPAVPATAIFGGLTTMAKLSLACATLVVGAALVSPFALARGAEEHHAEKPKPHAEEPAAKKGTATGEITKIDGGKVTLSENGKSETYWAHWHGGKPADGGGLDQKDVAAIAQCKVGDHVTIAWEFDEHRRIVSITKAN